MNFDLHLADREDQWADYIYDREASAFHSLRNRSLGFGSRAELAGQVTEIQNKSETSRRLAGLGILTPRTYLETEPGQVADLARLCSEEGPLFCKPRDGSRGLGAFTIRDGPAGIELQNYESQEIEANPTAYAACKLASRPYLVQELLVTHPSLAHIHPGASTDVATVRLITHSPILGEDRVYCAILEVPNDKSTSTGSLFYDLTALHPQTGIPTHRISSPSATSPEHEITDGASIPGWGQLLESGLRAHQQYPFIYAIAWDFAITERGPILLEGNTGWGVEIPQMINGPLLKPRRQSPETFAPA